LTFTISEIGSKSIETPFVISNPGIFCKTRERERGSKQYDDLRRKRKRNRAVARNITCPQQFLVVY
jgi:hypothetical protein